MSRGSSPVKVSEWTNRFDRFKKSQQTVVQFCKSEGVSPPSFYSWKKKLRDQQPHATAGSPRVGKGFQPVHIVTSGSVKLESTIHLGRGIHIELGSDLRIAESIIRQLLESIDKHSTGAE